MLAYAFTIFTGAFLLFQVQPLIGKYVLPWFGGGPGVWTVCMLFFQMLLLGGYAYAHGISKLPVRKQVTIHGFLLVASLLVLPIVPSARWRPEGGADPTLGIILLLSATVGLPYFVLSTTGPLIQKWFSLSQPGRSPYRLYALSNVGSLLALVTYPFIVEPALSRVHQAQIWSVGLGIFALACGWCAFRLWKTSPQTAAAAETETEADEVITSGRKCLWVLLPACASAYLLATTNKLCQDVAVIPFLWVAPLCMYLLSFIIAFDSPRWYLRRLFGALMAFFVIAVIAILMQPVAPHFLNPYRALVAVIDFIRSLSIKKESVLFCLALFTGCMACHGELYRLRPSPRHLTAFFLLISAGGALGGIFVALIAPFIFDRFYEFHLTTIACPAIYIVAVWMDRRRYKNQRMLYRLLAIGVGILIFSSMIMVSLIERERDATAFTKRNFYGALAVYEYHKEDPNLRYRVLQHGRITHGMQFSEALASKWPTTYYSEQSGIGLALANFPRQKNRRIGLVGLGTGTLATYGRPGDYLRIYEINPDVLRFATNYFTYLADSQFKTDIVLGDARLTMEKELERNESQQFDLIALDAFSSDAIPVHLLTVEAFEIYQRHLKPDGAIVVHVSNRYLDLQPVVLKIAAHMKWDTITIEDDPESDPERADSHWLDASTWIIVSNNTRFLYCDNIAVKAADDSGVKDIRLWTDDYSALYEVLY